MYNNFSEIIHVLNSFGVFFSAVLFKADSALSTHIEYVSTSSSFFQSRITWITGFRRAAAVVRSTVPIRLIFFLLFILLCVRRLFSLLFLCYVRVRACAHRNKWKKNSMHDRKTSEKNPQTTSDMCIFVYVVHFKRKNREGAEKDAIIFSDVR